MCNPRGEYTTQAITGVVAHTLSQVYEETGYNLENQLDKENVIQLSIREQSISLYIVPGVPENFPFQTRTRKEISVSARSVHTSPKG